MKFRVQLTTGLGLGSVRATNNKRCEVGCIMLFCDAVEILTPVNVGEKPSCLDGG